MQRAYVRAVWTLAIQATGTLAGCGEFLTVEPADEVSRAAAFSTVSGVDAAVVGLYNGLGHGSYYQVRMPIYADLVPNATLVAGDRGVSPSDIDGLRAEFTGINALAVDASYETGRFDDLYQRAYTVLYQANDVLAGIDELEAGDGGAPPTPAEAARLASLRGEALAVRAIVHHDLVRLFAQAPGFTPEASHAGIALVIGVPAIGAAPARNTVAEVYAAVRADLEAAEALLAEGLSRRTASPFWIDRTVARGLLARVAAYERDWEASYGWAKRCLAEAASPLTPRDAYLEAWARGVVPEAFWVLDLQRYVSADDGTPVLVSPARVFGAGLPEPYLQIGAGLFGAYAPGDRRRALFTVDTLGNRLSRKHAFAPNAIRNPVLLRRSEVVLLRAEAAAETGRLERALADLSLIARRADPAAALPPLQVDSLRAAIRRERRRELALEGHHFFDLGRWGADLVRPDCPPAIEACDLTYPDYRYALPIPQAAVERNPNLMQNPGY